MVLPADVRRAYEHLLRLGRYYDRQGVEITDAERYFECFSDEDYRIVLQETVGPYWVSTIWLGLDHNHVRRYRPGHEDDPPLIFETMVFAGEDSEADPVDFGGMDQRRWSTEEEALAGHAEMVALIRATMLNPPDTLEGEL